MSRQNNLLQRIERTLRFPAKIAAELVEYTDRMAVGVSNDFHLPLIQKLVQTRQTQRNGTAVVFSSISSGEGVTYVVSKIAMELLRHCSESVMVATVESLCGLEPVHFENVEPDISSAPKVWRLARNCSESVLEGAPLHPESLQ